MMKANIWDSYHKRHKQRNWTGRPSIFAKEVRKYIKGDSKILELGSGRGHDTKFFAANGFKVVSTDISSSAIETNRSSLPRSLQNQVEFTQLDMAKPFPYKNEEFDAVYAHLSLHYFDLQKTKEVLDEIHRVLKGRSPPNQICWI